MALIEANRKIECALIEESDAATFRLKARRRLFGFQADDPMAPGNWRFCPAGAPDIWCNMTVTLLTTRLGRYG